MKTVIIFMGVKLCSSSHGRSRGEECPRKKKGAQAARYEAHTKQKENKGKVVPVLN
jgi:hypothetical protein